LHDLHLSMSSKVKWMLQRQLCVLVMVDLAASIFSAHSTCQVYPILHYSSLLSDSQSPGCILL
jgi:hypothetical protein